MAITKILARKGRLDVGIRYVLNGDKTQEQILTARLNCDPGHECRQILETKRAVGKEGGVQYYHLIQSFQPGEVTPELALEIAREFAEEHLPGYQTVIGIHVDKEHIHAHILFNSVNADTGEKYHSNAQSYFAKLKNVKIGDIVEYKTAIGTKTYQVTFVGSISCTDYSYLNEMGDIMLRRNLLYTAVTRAKAKVILIGQKQAVFIAIHKCDVGQRNTVLADRIVAYYNRELSKRVT